MRPALHTVSYAGVWPGQAQLTLEETIQRTAKLGFAGVMIRWRSFRSVAIRRNSSTSLVLIANMS